MKRNFESTFEYKLIYVFRINDGKHNGCLKIGDATIKTNKLYSELTPNCHELNYAARERIDRYTSTAGIVYDLLYTEVAVFQDTNKNSKNYGKILAFRDYKVHEVLKRSDIKVKYFDTNRTQNEWFATDLQTVKNAIIAVKKCKSSLTVNEITNNFNPVKFRPEQREAINKTIQRYKVSNRMLWNAKMRFGKTLTALQVAKEMNLSKIIIITHRPVVSDGWYEDFKKIFYDKNDYVFGSKNKGFSIKELINSNKNFVYFASMQDLRGSDKVGGNFEKNHELFKIDWDFVVIDEAHEGTQTKLGKNVLSAIIKDESKHKTYVLELSGTPFNLITDFEQDSIYTWDYIMEQEAKENWILNNFGDSNPYEELPKMNIFTYHLEKSLPVYIDVEDKAFNFREFFRVWTGDINKDLKQIPNGCNKGDFVHENDIISFLDLICKLDENTNYPFSTEIYRDFFRHTLWMLPGVKEAKALSKLLKQHHIFSHFTIVNVAGDGDEEIDTTDALKAVRKAMTKNPNETYSITLSCGRLTTGVSIPEWTAVLMLSGTYSTAASQYLQTIFRVQTPANIDGRIKENCYVFDFAPDRTLKMVAESVQLSARAGSSNPKAEIALAKFLNYCPVISIDESGMKEFKVSYLLQELKKAYAERVARNGFDDPKIYNDELLKLTDVELKEFENLKSIIGASKQTKKTGDIDVNKEGFDDEQLEEVKKLERKPKKELTEEEKQRLAELKEKKKNRDSAISILRAISIRMPLLVYGMDKDIDVDITIDNFTELIDEASWEEFMPKGVDKETFKKFSKYYDKDIFVAASRRIRFISKSADELEPMERVKKIATLFSTFKNPDKETVLTPWRVVNLHLSKTIGGYNFYNDNYTETVNEPQYVEYKNITNNIFNKNSKILEINSKTGLYPLYLAFTLYSYIINNKDMSFDEKIKVWDKVISNQLYIVCKTKMAKQITYRTLFGYRKGNLNAHAFDDLIMQFKDKPDKFIDKIKNKSFWKKGEYGTMKFNAIVGNPPYQLQGGSGGNNDAPIYQYFVESSIKIGPDFSSLIIPARWFAAGRENLLGSFRKNMINNKNLEKLFVYTNSNDIFPTVEIKGGICFYLINKNYTGDCMYNLVEKENVLSIRRNLDDFDIIIRQPYLAEIVKKIIKTSPNGTVEQIISNDTPFGISSNVKTSTKNTIQVFSEPGEGHNTMLYHIEKLKRKIEYIDRNIISKNKDYIDCHKVFVPGSGGSGNDDIVLGKPEYAPVNSVCSQSYLFASFETKDEACNFIKYYKTKFFRILVSSIKISQSAPNRVYKFVPMQNYSNASDLNWNTSIQEIDLQLYKKYNLTEEEIKYIESNIRLID